MRKKKTKTVAIIIPQINTSFYSCFVYNIEKVASKFGYRIVLFQSFEEKEREKECLKTINDGSVDGAILLSKNKLTSLFLRGGASPLVKNIAAKETPSQCIEWSH